MWGYTQTKSKNTTTVDTLKTEYAINVIESRRVAHFEQFSINTH